jgi:cytochrome P450
VPSLGVRLPFGTYVFALLKAVHTDVGEWGDDALDFAPERWLVDGGADHDGTGATVDAPFYPFSTGPRDCPGRFMAAAFATATLAALAVRLDLAAVAGRPGEEHVALTAHAAGEGAMVRVRGRK